MPQPSKRSPKVSVRSPKAVEILVERLAEDESLLSRKQRHGVKATVHSAINRKKNALAHHGLRGQTVFLLCGDRCGIPLKYSYPLLRRPLQPPVEAHLGLVFDRA